MKRNKKTGIVLCLLTFIVAIVVACSKPGPGDGEPTPSPGTGTGGNADAPNLPSVSYNYVNNNIPAYFADYINANPTINNTPPNNPTTNEGAALGRVLFYDRHLSVNDKISCGSCHHQDKAFTDGTVQSEGFNGGHTARNGMSTINLRYFKASKMFWDLRAKDLETQVLMPVLDHVEMGMPSKEALAEKISKISYYPALFKSAFGTTEVTADKISKALAQFLRSIVSFNSKYDQGLTNNFGNFSTQELHGLQMVNRAFCTECHSDLSHVAAKQNPTFLIVENSGKNTGNGSNNGLDETFTDKGIGGITNKEEDMGTFKIPTLRNVELTAPYMHDGRFKTLEQVIEHYSTGIKNSPNRGVQILPGGFHFTDQEKADIIAFLKTLTDHTIVSDPRFSDPFKK
jgi:cytochrome c peroxidase